MPIVSVREPLADIAERCGLIVEQWEEDGLGQASGMFVRLPSGRVMLLRELQQARKYLGEEGPTVHADVGDLAEFGVEPLVAEVLQSLGLASDTVTRVASNDAQRIAAGLLKRLRS